MIEEWKWVNFTDIGDIDIGDIGDIDIGELAWDEYINNK